MKNRRLVVAGVLVVLLLAVGLGAAFYYGVGPAPGDMDSGDELTDFPTATASAVPMDESGPDATATEPPFSFRVDRIKDCGPTCRDVTATLHNNQDETATEVTVVTRVFAGNDNTAEEDLVWEGKEAVGTIDAGGSHTTTRRVELSLQEAYKIRQNDGWITIVTTVQTDEQAVTFEDSEQVA